MFLGGRGMTKALRDIKRKMHILNFSQEIGNVSKTASILAFPAKLIMIGKRAMPNMGTEWQLGKAGTLMPCLFLIFEIA